jgi:hypothetical protein
MVVWVLVCSISTSKENEIKQFSDPPYSLVLSPHNSIGSHDLHVWDASMCFALSHFNCNQFLNFKPSFLKIHVDGHVTLQYTCDDLLRDSHRSLMFFSCQIACWTSARTRKVMEPTISTQVSLVLFNRMVTHLYVATTRSTRSLPDLNSSKLNPFAVNPLNCLSKLCNLPWI